MRGWIYLFCASFEFAIVLLHHTTHKWEFIIIIIKLYSNKFVCANAIYVACLPYVKVFLRKFIYDSQWSEACANSQGGAFIRQAIAHTKLPQQLSVDPSEPHFVDICNADTKMKHYEQKDKLTDTLQTLPANNALCL